MSALLKTIGVLPSETATNGKGAIGLDQNKDLGTYGSSRPYTLYSIESSNEHAVQPELIPDHTSNGKIRQAAQRRTLRLWTVLVVTGLILFDNHHVIDLSLSPKSRAAAVTLLFPGAGYIAAANWQAAALLVLTYVLLPVTLFAWFGAGGIAFPIGLWILSAGGAYAVAGPELFDRADVVSALLVAGFVLYFNRLSARARKAGIQKRDSRNAFIPAALDTIGATAVAPVSREDRELGQSELRDIQWTIDQALLPLDDWTNFTVIDQFQTSALRYQLYEMMYCLGAYQGIYTPNFHGYLNTAHKNVIEKSLTPKVLNFWKWETLWGKFSTDFDPVKKENIMVTGFLLQGVALHVANTGDQHYAQPGSLKFQITEKQAYEYDIHSLAQAIAKQWAEEEFCLFACEPNWIYTPCNLQGMTGMVVYDRIFGTSYSKNLLPRFEASLVTNFTEPDGSILPIRSCLTGFTIPGLCGALTDLVNAMLCRGHLDHIARRMWAIFRTENIDYDEATGKMELKGLVGADKIDPGCYQSNEYALLPMLAYVAGEYGDEKIRRAAIDQCVAGVGKYTTKTGATALKGVSNSNNSCMVRASLLRLEDWKWLISEGPSKTTLAGPILDHAPYPGVLVAKARSQTSKDLDLVLYPSADSGTFELGLKRLLPGGVYGFAQETFTADDRGEAVIKVHVDGRTALRIEPR
ncbi:hypothetical protein A1O3_03237 [Capronia epimyces CBS 606.96]|uniref:Linalool dehydratase/isomerase domain-containing protein n=1 Tax=Capronia epimyces CBS 606.96 TaxID=1182542 RepID=W9YCB0_9EURO|nr:uncharacterized protein A1O3_03237 [Capronia epimyces CBS 606.96]EXJ90168.1 hypothetical protein A1O3_03237 [Capronia epimyces CBS 606.96]